ncbi:MAG: hypothetical protein J2P44_09030, partial [Candidatus Dormibacteraeota bacterium]|nr:hypothetical protein [Candidatus Dormibacteraeota bacterium]
MERLRSLGVPPFTGDHYAAALEELNRARGDAASSAAFFPRHRGLSLLQSSLATCIEAGGNDLLQEARTPRGAPSQVADQELRPGLDLFRRFGPCDPGWLGVTVAEGLRLFEARPEFPDRPAPSVELADEARVVLVGDWGTGLPGAQAVGRAMARELAAAAGRDRHLIHLGDVYYSGWKEEYERHFLRYWPHREGEGGLHSWTLNGNHDMYSG